MTDLPKTANMPDLVADKTVLDQPKKLVNRCSQVDCKKKLLLTDILCRCEKRFCLWHRQPETHACTYDFKASGIANLSANLVKVGGDSLKHRI